jgi:RluA family pseudouridine synthase
MSEIYSCKVESPDGGSNLQTWLRKQLDGEYSSKQIKLHLEKNTCRINGKVQRFASTKLRSGDRVEFDTRGLGKKQNFSFSESEVLYEDENLLIYNKPPGLTSDQKGIVSMITRARSEVHLVHRLDRFTSGAMVLAKNQKTCKELEELFRERKVKKEYVTVVAGQVLEAEGCVLAPIRKLGEKEGKGYWGIDPSGAPAETTWNCLEHSKVASLIRCFPKTGRTHQIRLHMISLGHPILGDFHYNRAQFPAYPIPRLLLHSERIAFGDIDVKAPIPKDMNDVINAFF